MPTNKHMKKKRLIFGIIALQFILFPTFAQDKLLGILKTELHQQMQELQKKEFPPYHMNYRVIDKHSSYVAASFGALMTQSAQHQRHLVTQVRIGNPSFDNFRNRDMGAIPSQNGIAATPLPIDDEGAEDAIRQAIWFETCNRYRFAVDFYQQALAEHSIQVGHEDKAPCFSPNQVEKYYEEPFSSEKIKVDLDKWAQKIKEISAIFNRDDKIVNGNAAFKYYVERRYFVNTEGTE